MYIHIHTTYTAAPPQDGAIIDLLLREPIGESLVKRTGHDDTHRHVIAMIIIIIVIIIIIIIISSSSS